MQLTSILAILALSGPALAAPNSERPPTCVDDGLFYGEADCKLNCAGGACTLSEGQEKADDYICICEDASQAGCSTMFHGKEVCNEGCDNGNCVQLLQLYNCKCAN